MSSEDFDSIEQQANKESTAAWLKTHLKGISFCCTAWHRNEYKCYECKHEWTDHYGCEVDDDCPECGARHNTPADSDCVGYRIQCPDCEDFTYYSLGYQPAEHDGDPYVCEHCKAFGRIDEDAEWKGNME